MHKQSIYLTHNATLSRATADKSRTAELSSVGLNNELYIFDKIMKVNVTTIEICGDKPGCVPLDGVMRAGDVVEFISDRQTEKGPSSGTIIVSTDVSVTISHSDHPGEEFSKEALHVKGEFRHKDGLRKLWILA